MRRLFLLIALTAFFAGCDKKESDDDVFVTCLNTHSWLDDLVKEYQSCVCLTKIMYGTYQGETVFETRGFDPLCDGIDVVYKADGTRWFTTGDRDMYADYQANASVREIWRCSKDSK